MRSLGWKDSGQEWCSEGGERTVIGMAALPLGMIRRRMSPWGKRSYNWRHGGGQGNQRGVRVRKIRFLMQIQLR